MKNGARPWKALKAKDKFVLAPEQKGSQCRDLWKRVNIVLEANDLGMQPLDRNEKLKYDKESLRGGYKNQGDQCMNQILTRKRTERKPILLLLCLQAT